MSSYYGIVFPEFWTGDTGRAIQQHGGKDAQLTALYLMSCRHATMIGLYALQLRDIRHETGIGLKGLAKAFAVLDRFLFATYDARTEHVWVREMAKFRLSLQKKSPLDSDDKRVTGIQRLYEQLAVNPFLEPFFDRYARELRMKGKRTCGVEAHPLLDVAPSKGLIRGLEGPCKPVNRSSGTRDQGSEIRDQEQGSGKSTAASRRPVQIDEGTYGLYCVIAREARNLSLEQDHSDSVSNVVARFKDLCGSRHLTYDSEKASKAIEATMRPDDRTDTRMNIPALPSNARTRVKASR